MLIFVSFLIPFSTAVAQSSESQTYPPPDHSLTLYVIRSVKPLDWQSPASLYKSYKNAFCSTLFRKEKTLLGHLFIRLSTPLLEEPLYAGITNLSKKEMRGYVLKEKIGLAVLGAGMKARMQFAGELMNKIEFYTNKRELAFITYRINEEGVSRIIEFYREFIQKYYKNPEEYDFYGGAFWPLYENEGAGCSALGLAMLELANIRGDETRLWKKEVNIPMNLIGGKFNNHLKVNAKKLKTALSWHSGEGTAEMDYLPFEIYDPTLMYNWILAQLKQVPEEGHPQYYPAKDSEIPGLISDRCFVTVNRFIPLFQNRPDTNLFIKHHYLKFNNPGKN